MAHGTAFLGHCASCKRSVSEYRTCGSGSRDYIDMFVVREADLKIRRRSLAFPGCVEDLPRIRKRVPRAVPRRWIGMTNGADRRGAAAKKLLTMAADARLMLRIIGDIRECGRAGADLVPIWRRELVARCAFQTMSFDIVREFRIFSRRSGSGSCLTPRGLSRHLRAEILRIKSEKERQSKENDSHHGTSFGVRDSSVVLHWNRRPRLSLYDL